MAEASQVIETIYDFILFQTATHEWNEMSNANNRSVYSLIALRFPLCLSVSVLCVLRPYCIERNTLIE